MNVFRRQKKNSKGKIEHNTEKLGLIVTTVRLSRRCLSGPNFKSF